MSTAEKVRFLATPANWPGRPQRVEVRETHMAWVFLAGRMAMKLKKPVTTPLLDFGSPAAREADCRTEVRLNARLAPGVYLGVEPLTLGPGGLGLGGAGEVVDWVVRMRRLPEERMLDRIIALGGPPRGDVERLGGLLAEFYAGLAPAELPPSAYVERFRAQLAADVEVLGRARFELDGGSLTRVAAALGQFLERDAELLAGRVRAGRVVEGHGDLRPEHVCLNDPPVVIDCLEFNRFLRLVDPFDDVALLDVECARLGAAWIGEVLREELAARLGERPPRPLLEFYAAARASLRARLALAHLTEPETREPERWPRLAREYLALAARASARLTHP